MNYEDLFDPVETTPLSEILVSPEAQNNIQKFLDPQCPEICHLELLPLQLRGECCTPVLTTTIEVPVIEDVARIFIRRVSNPSNASSGSDEEENIDTRPDPRVISHSLFQEEPSSVQERLPSTI